MSVDRDIPEIDSRRSFLKTALYVAPAVLTLKAAPAYASNGSGAPAPSRGGGFMEQLELMFRPRRG